MDLAGLAKASEGLKKAETVVKEADLKTQVAGESVAALAGTHVVDATALGAVTLNKAETVVKEATLKEQVAGEKASALAGTHPVAEAIKARVGVATKALFDTHVGNFGPKNVEGLAAEYDDDSVLVTHVGDVCQTYKGWSAIKPVFEGLFANQYGPDAKLAVPDVELQGSMVFITWNTEAGPKPVKFATDTFVRNEATNKWAYQTVVVRHDDGVAGPPTFTANTDVDEATKALFDTHVSNFGPKNVEGLAAEYDDDSVLVTHVDGERTVYKGWSAIKPVFEGLFANEYGPDAKLAVPVVELQGSMAFITWNTEGGPSPVKFATDTFVINKATNKWAYQTVVIRHA